MSAGEKHSWEQLAVRFSDQLSGNEQDSRTVHLHAAALVKHISLTIKQTPLEFTPLCVVFHSGRTRACQDWKGRSNKPQRQSRAAQSLQGKGWRLQLPEEGRAFSGIPGDCSFAILSKVYCLKAVSLVPWLTSIVLVEQRWFHYLTKGFVLQQPSCSTPSL